jgi:hypothetical protein
MGASEKASFSSLPYELRQIIWVETFEPRILTIEAHFNKAYTKRRRTNRMITWGSCCTYTAKLGVHPSRKIRKRGTKGYVPVLTPESKALLPPGPAALYVCRDSRAIAMQDYRLAFRGSTNCVRDQSFLQNWIKSGHNQGRIWIDYKRDSIFFCDLSDKKNIFFGFPDEEAVKVQTLAACYDFTLPDVSQRLHKFWSLKIFQVYYSFESEDNYESGRERIVERLNREWAQGILTPLPNVVCVCISESQYSL